MDSRPLLRELTRGEVEAELRRHDARGAATLARDLYLGVHQDAARTIAAVARLGPRQRALAQRTFDDRGIALESVHGARDGSTKFRFRLADSAWVEAVLLPHHGRHTVCVSSQAGCPLACAFCATGMLGLTRSLAAHEIVDQVHQVMHHARVRIDEIVFMGMGEPLLNEDAVYRAARVFAQVGGMQIAAKRLNVSTAGVVPAIHRFIDQGRPYRMLFSLGSAVPEKRERLMPIQRRFGFAAFLDAVRRYEAYRRHKHVTLEYVAIRGITMGDEDIDAIRENLTGFRFILNVIPLNPVGNELEAPSASELAAWTSKLRPLRIPVKIRRSGATSEYGGCGQLGRAGESG